MYTKQPQPFKIITTSWDDGHPLDFKLAELLDKYQLKATFYIPEKNMEQPVITPAQVKELSALFEIGGHTINHTRLNTNNKAVIDNEISGSYAWLKNLLGKLPVSFAFPGGKYSAYAINKVFENGYAVARTTELLSKSVSSNHNLMPTTLQVYQHSKFTYSKHLLKRKRIYNLISWMQQGAIIDLLKLTENFLKNINQAGGCFHLWGHSWEMQQYNLWNKLEEIFKLISHQKNFSYLTNGDAAALKK